MHSLYLRNLIRPLSLSLLPIYILAVMRLVKCLETYDGVDRDRFTITGILKDVPPNSHFKFDLVTRGPSGVEKFSEQGCGAFGIGEVRLIFLVNEKSNAITLGQKLDKLAVSKNGLKTNKDDYGQVSTFDLQPLKDIHLHSNLLYELDVNGSGVLVYAMIFLAAIVIIIAWINYVNLSTAITEQKSKSIGVRKIVGASRLGLIFQFLIEVSVIQFHFHHNSYISRNLTATFLFSLCRHSTGLFHALQ